MDGMWWIIYNETFRIICEVNMKELILAGNKIYSKKIDQHSVFHHKLRVLAYEEFNHLFEKSSDINLFKTPVDFNNPESGPGYQYVFTSKEFNEYVTDLINSELNSNMKVTESWCLMQTNESWVNNPKHVHMTSDWVASMYLDISPGDSIQFFDENGNMEEYEPEFGEIVLFHSTAIHRPKENISEKRLSLNADLKQEISESDAEKIKNKFLICKSCDKYFEDSQKCNECNCYIPMKIQFDDSKCPLNKW